jgi:hypothetical protein
MDCIKTNRKVDSLKEWKLEGKNERGIYYKDKRGRYVAFLLHKDTSGIYLKKISYQIASHQIKVFSNNSLNEYKINDKTHFTVWTSKKDHVFYFCMINPSNIVIWILKNHQTLYIFNSTL